MAAEDSEVGDGVQVDDELQRLSKKQEDGALNIVKKVLNQPEVQNAIKQNISKQTFISGLFMSFFLVGFFMLFNVAKVVLNYNWLGDMALGLVLIAIGSAYMFRQMRRK